MFSIQEFFEIQIVGLLTLIALSPIRNIASRRLHHIPGLFPGLSTYHDRSAAAIGILALALVAGVMTSRLGDDLLLDPIGIEGKEQFAQTFAIARGCRSGKVERGRDCSLKVAEFRLAGDNDYAASYFNRHKSFMRLLRGAAILAPLYLLTMITYDVLRRRWNGAIVARYARGYYVFVAIFALLSLLAYRLESTHLYRRICELGVGDGVGCGVGAVEFAPLGERFGIVVLVDAIMLLALVLLRRSRFVHDSGTDGEVPEEQPDAPKPTRVEVTLATPWPFRGPEFDRRPSAPSVTVTHVTTAPPDGAR